MLPHAKHNIHAELLSLVEIVKASVACLPKAQRRKIWAWAAERSSERICEWWHIFGARQFRFAMGPKSSILENIAKIVLSHINNYIVTTSVEMGDPSGTV